MEALGGNVDIQADSFGYIIVAELKKWTDSYKHIRKFLCRYIKLHR